jgi:hypothetical protein
MSTLGSANPMNAYFCIVSADGEPVADLCVLDAETDNAALRAARRIAKGWAALERIDVYQGERPVGSVFGPAYDVGMRQAA